MIFGDNFFKVLSASTLVAIVAAHLLNCNASGKKNSGISAVSFGPCQLGG